MGSDIVARFLFEGIEIIFEKSKKINLDETCVAERPVNVFLHCALVESISEEPKTIGHDQNFVLLSTIVFEISSQSLSKSMKNYF